MVKILNNINIKLYKACEQWYHPQCLTITPEEAKNFINITWHCDECKQKKKSIKK
jgi:hypothetical protein